MKKHFLIILCCLFALSTGSVLANSNSVEMSSSKISLNINLGDVSEFDIETLDAMVSDAFADFSLSSGDYTCSVSVSVSIGVISVTVGVEGDCDKFDDLVKQAISKAKRAVKATQEALKAIL